MRKDIIPAPASSISAPTPIKGAVGPPVAGRLPPAAAAAEAVALPLAVAVDMEVAVDVEVAVVEVALAVAKQNSSNPRAQASSAVICSFATIAAVSASCTKGGVVWAKATDANSNVPNMDSPTNNSSLLKVPPLRVVVCTGENLHLPFLSTSM
jgi:hypothetical protein